MDLQPYKPDKEVSTNYDQTREIKTSKKKKKKLTLSTLQVYACLKQRPYFCPPGKQVSSKRYQTCCHHQSHFQISMLFHHSLNLSLGVDAVFKTLQKTVFTAPLSARSPTTWDTCSWSKESSCYTALCELCFSGSWRRSGRHLFLLKASTTSRQTVTKHLPEVTPLPTTPDPAV